MRDFHDLSRRGRARRLRELAIRALQDYPIEVMRVSLLTHHWNAVFRVDVRDGRRFVMRVCVPEFDAEETRAEMLWMAALAAETDVSVPAPLRTHAGDVLTVAAVPGVPEPRICTLLSWVKGRVLDVPDAEMAHKWGMLAASLHTHAESFRLPSGYSRFTVDKVLPWPTDRLVIFDNDFAHVMTHPGRADLLRRALQAAEDALKDLHAAPHEPHLIHNDLHPWNIMHYRGQLTVIDFEDSALGFPVQDVGTALYHVCRYPAFDEIRAAFKAGYCERRPWVEAHEGQLDVMMLARAFNIINMALLHRFITDAPTQTRAIDWLAAASRSYLDNGRIHASLDY